MVTDEVDQNTEIQRREKDDEGEPIFSVDDGDRSGTAPPPARTQVQDQFQRLDADFQTLAATFENWKPHDAMRRIVKRHQQEQLRHWRASMSPVCAHAVFHWVLITLPETHSFETQCQVLPISVLQRMGNPPSTESMSVTQHVALRLWVWKLRVIFHTWRSDTRKKHAFRRNLNQRRRAQMLDFAFACFQKWVLFTELHKCQHAKCAWIAQRRARNHLRGCVDHWRACLQQMRRGNAASKHHDRRVLSQVLAAWKHTLAMTQAASQLHKRSSRRSAIRQWRRFVARRQSASDVEQRAADRYRSKMLVSYWRCWRAYVRYAHGIHLKISYCRRKHCRRDQRDIFECWKRWLERNHKLRQLRARLERRQRRRVRERAFSWWVSWKEAKRNITLMVLDAVARRDVRWLQQVFTHWAMHLATSRQQDSHRITEIHRLEKRRHWNAWRKVTQVQRCIVRVLLSLHRRHMLCACIESWRHATQRKLLNLDLVVHARYRCVLRIMRKCWRAFSDHVSTRRVQQLKGVERIQQKSHARASMCVHAWNVFTQTRLEQTRKCGHIAHVIQRDRLLHATWSAWRIAFREVQTLHLVKRFVEVSYKRRGFTSWRCFWKRRQQERARVAGVAMKLGLQRMRRTLVHWEALATWRKTLQVAHGRCQSHRGMTSLTKAWGAWRHLYLLRVKQHDHVARVLDKWCHQQLQVTFLTWKSHWRLRRDHRRLVAMMHVTKKENTFANCFSMWKTCAKAKRTQLHAAQSNHDKLVHFRAKRVLSTWHLRSQAARRTACLLKHCVAMQKQTTLNGSFRRCKAFHVMSARKMQQHNAATHHCCLHLQHSCCGNASSAQMLALQQLHGTFLAEWLTQQIEARMTTLNICENVMRTKVHRRLLATTWQAWTQWQDRKWKQWVAICRLQQQIAALSAASSKHYRMKDASTEPFDCSVRATLVRWRCLPVAKSFRKWAIDAHNERVLRESTLAALELWQKNHLRRTFAYWHVFSMTEKQQCVLARKSIFSKTSRCWRRWRHYVANAKHAKTQHTLATTQWWQRILNAYFSTWHHWCVHLQLQRRMVLQVYSATCLRLVRALFEIWTQFAVSRRTKRVQTTVALVRYEAKLVRTSWQTWRTHTALSQYHRQQLRANTERLQILLLCSSFRGWRQYATQTRRLTNIARLLSSKCDMKTASTIIAAWHQHVQRKLHLQHTAVTLQRLAAFHKGLAALKHAVDAKKHHRAASDKAKLFVSILRDHQVARHFLRWQTLWTLGRKKRLAIRHFHQQKLLPRVWTAWVQVVAFNKRSSDRLAMAAHAWKHAFVRKAWRALLAHHQLAIQRRERIVQGEIHYTTRTLKAAIALWRHETAHIQRLNATSRKLLLRWRLQAVYCCFSNWQRVVRNAIERRRCHEIVKATSKILLMLRSWGSWRKLFVVTRTGTRKSIQRAWRRWLEFREEARMLTQFQHAIAATYLRSTQTRLVAQWKQFVVDNKLRRAMALLSVEFASTQVVRHTWHRWRRFVHHSHADKRKISAVVHRMRFHTQMKVLHAVQIHAVTRKRKRRLAERVATFHSMNLQTRDFREWKRVALTAKSRRAKLAHCVHLLQHSVQRKTFLAWSDFVEKRLELRTKMAKALALKTQLCTRTVWNAWTAFAHNSCRNKLAKRYCGARICTRSLHQWRKFVILCKVEHMLGASHKRMLENGFVAWRKLVARNRSVRAFQLKATQTHQKQQVRACFDAWRHRSRLQQRCKQILCSAVNGNHLRFRFTIWSKFATRPKLLKQMLTIPLNAFSKLQVKRPANIDGVSSPEDLDASTSPDILSEGCAATTNAYGEEGDANSHEEPDELVSIAIALARKARFFQRFEITWDVPQTWQRWRHIFHARLFYRLRKLHAHFVVWQAWSHQRKRMRNVLTCFQGEQSVCALRTVFHGWKNVVQRVKQLQRQRLRDRELWTIVNTEMVRSERRCLKKHWEVWRGYVDEKRHLHTSLEVYHRARVVTKYWLVWNHDFLHAMRVERAQCHTQRQHMLLFLRRRALRRLKEY
ncbi:hypothetical protein FI667_g13602, partial [Globisporangium splendens]